MSDTSSTPAGGFATVRSGSDEAPPVPTEVAKEAASKAKDVGGAGLDQAKAVAVDAKDQAAELASQATDHARKAVGMTKDELRSMADDRTQQLSTGLRSLAQQLGSISTDEGGVVEDIGHDVGQRLSGLAERLDHDGLDGAVQQITSLARRRPGAFLLGAAAAGFVAARVLRDTKDIISDAPTATSNSDDSTRSIDERAGALASPTPSVSGGTI